MARVGSLSVDLRANTAAFSAGLEKSRRQAQGFAKGVGADLRTIGLGLGAAAAAATAFGAALVLSSAKAADRLAKLSQQTGISVETLSGLGFAAEQAGIDQQFLADRMVNLQRRALKSTESVNSYTKAFERLGVDVLDAGGNLKDTETLLREVADAFAGMEDGTEKAALATEIFSNQGTKLIPLLNEGSGGLDRFMARAGELGQVIDTETARAAEQFNDNLDILGKSLTGVGNTILAEVVPTLVALTEETIEFIQESDLIPAVAEAFGFLFKTIVSSGRLVLGMLEGIGITFKTLGEAAIHAQEGNFTRAITALATGTSDLAKIWDDTAKSMVVVWTGSTARIREDAERTADSVGLSSTQLADKVKTTMASLQQQVDTFAASEAFLFRYKLAQEGITEEIIRQNPELARLVAQYKALFLPLIQQAAQVDMPEFTEALHNVGNEVEFVGGAINDVAGFVGELPTKFDAAGESIGDVSVKMDLAGVTAETLKGGLGELFGEAIRGGRNFVGILKGIIQELAQIIIKLLIIKALGFFFGGFFGEGGEVKGAQAGATARVGQTLLVGERGPELFLPKVPGEIVPLQAGGAVMARFAPAEERGGPGTIINLTVPVEGLVSPDNLQQVIRMISDAVMHNDVELAASFAIAPPLSRS